MKNKKVIVHFYSGLKKTTTYSILADNNAVIQRFVSDNRQKSMLIIDYDETFYFYKINGHLYSRRLRSVLCRAWNEVVIPNCAEQSFEDVVNYETAAQMGGAMYVNKERFEKMLEQHPEYDREVMRKLTCYFDKEEWNNYLTSLEYGK